MTASRWLTAPPLAAQRRLSRAAEFVEDQLAEAKASAPAMRTTARGFAGCPERSPTRCSSPIYVVGDDSDVGVIFETLNQRGKDLTELEKTKNYLLYLASLLPDGPRQQLAATVNDSWRTIFANLGSAQLGPAHEDQLLRAHWLATQNPRQREWDKIRSVKTRFHRTKYRTDKPRLLQEVTAYALSLREASAAYRDIVTDSPQSFAAYGPDAAEIRKSSRQLRQAGVVAIFAPLLIAARLRFPADGQAYGSVVDLCERYSVRVFLINERRSNAGSTRLYSLAYQLHRDGNLPWRWLAWPSGSSSSPETSRPQRSCGTRAATGTPRSATSTSCTSTSCTCSAAPRLSTVSSTSRTANSGHPRPSTSSRRPPTATAGWFSVPRTARCTRHCLGNLVLTNDNRVYSNYCFTRKRDGITGPDGQRSACYRTSVLKQEQDLAAFSEWTPVQVQQRQEMLAQWAIKRWELGPDHPVTDMAAVAVTGEEDLDDADMDPLLSSIPENENS